jgi:outer membrane protein assembly factor BamE (lipoprotein component of BamABCDE complex)
VGATQEQVLIVLGTPSTVATVSGEAFYYISQRAERLIGFMPQQVTDQRVVAVYFDKNRRVERLANYGLKDGRVFDFVSRTTPTGGKDVAYLNAIFKLSPF